MNFFDTLKKILPIVSGIEHFAGPIIGTIYPPAIPALAAVDNIVTRIQSAIITVEKQIPQDGQGTVKHQMVAQDFAAYISDLKSSLGVTSKVSYDDNELKAAISSQAEAFNHFAKLKASIKIA